MDDYCNQGKDDYSDIQDRTSGVTLNADLDPKIHHQTPMTCIYGYSRFIHFKTVATEVEIQFLEKSPVQTVAIKLEAHNSLEYHYMLKH